MLHILKNRRDQARSTDDGFTLIELMVVVLIIAILLAIAIPTFLGAQNKAKDRSAQSSLRNGLTAAKTIFTDSSDYDRPPIVGAANPLQDVEPSLQFVATDAASTDPKIVSFNACDNHVLCRLDVEDGHLLLHQGCCRQPGRDHLRQGRRWARARVPPRLPSSPATGNVLVIGSG